MLKTNLGLGPKTKFVVLNSNYNFYERSNFISRKETIVLPRSKQHHKKGVNY
jgi:hypothetical protein